MNILDAIAIRKSRRSYLSDPIPPSILERLMELMAEFNREQGLSFRFIEDGSAAFASLARSYGMFSGVKALMVLAGKKDDPDRREKCGYFGERLVLEATAYGLGTCWVGGTFDKKHPDLGVPGEDEAECVVPIGFVPDKPAFRERLIHRLTHGLTADTRAGTGNGGPGKEARSGIHAEAGSPGGREGTDWGLSVEADGRLPDRIRAGIEAALKAPSAKNAKPVRFSWKGGKLTARIPDTYALQWVDLGIAKFHFVLAAGGKFPWGNGAAWESEGTER